MAFTWYRCAKSHYYGYYTHHCLSPDLRGHILAAV